MKDKARRKRTGTVPRSCFPDYSAPFLPSPDDIARGRDEVQEGWSDAEFRIRGGDPVRPPPFEFPQYHGDLPHD